MRPETSSETFRAVLAVLAVVAAWALVVLVNLAPETPHPLTNTGQDRPGCAYVR